MQVVAFVFGGLVIVLFNAKGSADVLEFLNFEDEEVVKLSPGALIGREG